MTFSPAPADTRAFLQHLDIAGLLAHARAACALLAEHVIEDLGRTPGGLDHLFRPGTVDAGQPLPLISEAV